MARLPRLDLPDIAQHIVQRGNNRLPCFLDDADRLRYLYVLQESLAAAAVRLHAYVLMDNHVHLLATPSAAGDIGRMMQRLGRRYVAWFNSRHGRTGTLWEGRYKASLVDNERYFLACCRYIELNPVRARIIDDPAAWRWSSCAAHLGLCKEPMLSPHPAWLAIASTDAERATFHRRYLAEGIPAPLLSEIRLHLQQQRALGNDAFRAMVQERTQRFAATRPAHRPRAQRA